MQNIYISGFFGRLFIANIVILCLTCFSSFAGTFTIGAGASVNTATSSGATPSPYGNYYEGRREQFLLRASDLTGAGVSTERIITQLGFNVSTLNTCCGNNGLTGLTIQLKNTATTTLTTAWETGLTTVYGPIDYKPTTGWNMHGFDTYFTWDGTSNILVQVCFNDEGIENFSQNAGTFYTTGLPAGTTTGRSADNDVDMCGDVTAGAVGTSRVNTRLVMYNPGNMTYTSSTTTQAVTTSVVQGSNGNQIIGVEIVTDLTANPLSATSFTFNTTGSTNASNDIGRAELYYTGVSPTYSPTDGNGGSSQVGSTAFNPNGAFTITLSQPLKPGTNYFWLTYSINSTATVSNVVDAQCTALNVSGARTPTVTAPAGTRTIVAYSSGAYGAATGGATTKVAYITKVEFNSIQSNTGNDCSGTSYYCNYTTTSTTIYMAQSYQLNISVYSDFASAGLRYATAAVYIDWNRDGDFLDASETVLSGLSGATGAAAWNTFNLTTNIVPPAGAILGSTRMRVGGYGSVSTIPPPTGAISPAEYEDYTVIIAESPEMVYIGSTTIQNTDTVDAGTTINQVVCLRVETSGQVNPMPVSSLILRTTGTTAVADIANARLYSTGTSGTFATTTQVGSTIASPPASPTNMTFTPTNLTLESGYNYFWLAYDVNTTAPQGNVVDAECISATISSVVRTPSPTTPSGSRWIRRVNMAYSSATVSQDNISYVAKGDINQVVIGIKVVTAGSLNPINATSFSLNTTGTSNPGTDIQNAKLWYTGSSSVFATGTQFGATVAAPSGSYAIAGTQTLLTGINYFWLTYDIKATAACNPNKVDAQCTSVTVGGSPYTPSPTTVLGDRIIDCNTPYYSQGNLVANTLASWNSQRNGSGAAPSSFSTSYSFYIQNGHSMTTTANVTIPYMIIESGGYITATNLVTMTDLRINTNGTWHQKFKATVGTYITNFIIYNGGTWIHDNNGYLPNQNRNFQPRSNQWFYQWGGGTFPAGTAWGNVLLNGTTTGNFEMGTVLTNIQGDFEWRKIGSSNYLFDARDEAINIGGNLIISGGWWKMGAGYNTALTNCNTVRSLTVNVTGNFIVSAGTLEDNLCGPSGTKVILNVGGNVDISGGIIDLSTAAGQLSELNLTGGTASVTWSQTGGSVLLGRTNIKTGKTVTMIGTKMGDVATGLPIIVETGATLNCSNYPVTGAGLFTLQTGATIGSGSAAGLESAGAVGNVQVGGTRSYNSGATYRYYEGLTPQSTGNFTSTTDPNIANLIIDKSGATNIVNITKGVSPGNSFNVTNNLNLIQGELNLNVRTLTVTNALPAGITRTNGYVKSEVNAAVNNSILQWNIGADASPHVFPFGVNSANYIPVTFDGSGAVGNISISTRPTIPTDNTPWAGLSNVAAVSTMNDINGVDGSVPSTIDRWWDITSSLNPSPGTTAIPAVTLSLTYLGAENTMSLPTETVVMQHWNGSASVWDDGKNGGAGTYVTTGTAGTQAAGPHTVSASGFTYFSPYVLARIGAPLAPLPVELLSFRADCKGDKVLAEWETASETNNDYFTLDKSTDGTVFYPVAKVPGAGNSSSIKKYSAEDAEPFSAAAYYRLSQTDYDGKTTSFDIVAVKGCGNDDITAYSSGSEITVSVNSKEESNYNIVLLDAHGKIILDKKEFFAAGNSKITLPVLNASNGVYILKIFNDRNIRVQKVSIQK